VAAQLVFLKAAARLLGDSGGELRERRMADRRAWPSRDVLPVSWAVDESVEPSRIDFHGYESRLVDSPFGEDEQRRVFDRSRPYRRAVPFRDRFRPVMVVDRPAAWVVPAAWRHVIERLEANDVQMIVVDRALEVEAERARIGEVESLDAPWEGHFYHRGVSAAYEPAATVTLQAGDRVIPSDQPAVRYLAAVFAPAAPDSFFRWNFFDTILARKEYFSSYLFEPHALDMLENDDDLRTEFEALRAHDPDFPTSRRGQLQWLYERSRFAEPAYRLYPVMRLPQWPDALARPGA
jgi:hypothetical protein